MSVSEEKVKGEDSTHGFVNSVTPLMGFKGALIYDAAISSDMRMLDGAGFGDTHREEREAQM